MSKTLKEVRQDLQEAVEASKTDLQYIRAKTASNNHFEARRYIADKILKDKKLADAYKSLEMIHDTYGRYIGNDAITLRQRLEKMMIDDLKRKIQNWDAVYSAL
jgi:hypothetical protein